MTYRRNRRTAYEALAPIVLLSGLVFLGAAVRASRVPLATASAQSPLIVDAHIGGTVNALATDGTRVVAGVGPRVVVLDTGAGGDPRWVATSDPLPADVRSVEARSGWLYAGYGGQYEDDGHGMAVFDGRGTVRAERVGELPLDGLPVGMWLRGATLFVATRREVADTGPGATATPFPMPTAPSVPPLGSEGYFGAAAAVAPASWTATYRGGALSAIDVSDPTAPRRVGQVALDEAPIDLAGQGDRVAVLAAGAGPRDTVPSLLVAFDVADAAQPRVLGRADLGTWVPEYAGLAIAGGFAYVATDLDGLVVVDLGQPGGPRAVAHVDAWSVTDVAVVGALAYAVGQMGGTVVDVAEPTTPRVLGEVPGDYAQLIVSDRGLVAIQHVFPQGAPAEGNHAGITQFDLGTNPLLPLPVGRWTSLVDVTSIAVEGGRLFASIGASSLMTIDADAPGSPQVLGLRRWTDSGWLSVATQMVAGAGRVAMVSPASSPSSLYVADGVAASVAEPGPRLGLESLSRGIAMQGGLIALVVTPGTRAPWLPGDPSPEPDGHALRLFDASDAANGPREVGATALEAAPIGVAMQEGTAYVATQSSIAVFDVADPASPRAVGIVPDVPGRGGYDVRSMALADRRLAVVTADGARIFDVSDPHVPRAVADIVLANIVDIVLSDRWLAAATRDVVGRGRVALYALSGPSPALAAEFEPPSAPVSLAFQGEHLVVATDASGIYWLWPSEGGSARPIARGERVWLPALGR